MMIQTTVGVPLDAAMLNNYFRTLVNLFFKILPIKESGESSLEVYMRSLQAELLGCKELIEAIQDYIREVRQGELTEHGFPRLGVCIGILIANGRRADLLDEFTEIMDICCAEIP